MTQRPARVLIAEHDEPSLPDVRAELLGRAIEVRTSDNLVDTVACIESWAPDLVILHPLAAGVDGFEVERVAQAGGEEADRSLLLATADPEPIAGLLEASGGAVDDVVCLPVRAEELVLRIVLNLARRAEVRRLEREARALEQETITDFKTGLHNDRFLFQRLREEVERSRRHRLALGLILFDFDDFKRINDRFDHVFGDFVLAAFARKLRASLRSIDVPARLGGDEFAVLLPSTDLAEAGLVATRLQEAIAACRFEKDGASTGIAVSMGVDAIHGDELIEPEEFLKRADQALLEAKKRGKNRVCLYPELAARAASRSAGS